MPEIQWQKSPNLVPYEEAINYMENRVDDIISGKKQSLIWFLEHEAIYTAGSSSSEKELLSENLPIYKTNRGGKYTYHGPGQRIIYFILDIKKILGVTDLSKFIFLLEEIIISALAKVNISSFRKEKFTGVWVKENNVDKKIAALGIRVRKWVSYHGVAINYNPDLKNFSGIIPCGIEDFGVSSIINFTNKYSIEEFDMILTDSIKTIFELVD